MDNGAKLLIFSLHLFLLLYLLLTPFYGNTYLLIIHCLVLPFIVFHWLIKNDVCALTIMEKKIRKDLWGQEVESKDCFMAHLVEPVYNLRYSHSHYAVELYSIAIFLCIYASMQLYKNFTSGKITSLADIMIV